MKNASIGPFQGAAAWKLFTFRLQRRMWRKKQADHLPFAIDHLPFIIFAGPFRETAVFTP